jgi:hypothetical protein
MLWAWRRAGEEGHDVLAVSGVRTINEALLASFDGYALTRGICNAAVLYRGEDWQQLLSSGPDPQVVRQGFDLFFLWRFAPRARPGAVAVSVQPSVVYHTGLNGLHVRNVDVNLDYAGDPSGLLQQ